MTDEQWSDYWRHRASSAEELLIAILADGVHAADIQDYFQRVKNGVVGQPWRKGDEQP